ncbi:HelD family protein [Polymorphospora rubra]|nr:UvrD-helicase domain-containing protein [Polymorphospora rubra]
MLYQRLDAMRDHAAKRLARALRETGGTPQARSQRDTATAMYREQVAQFDAVENGLCFGRLDFDDDRTAHVGRIGIFDETHGHRPLLVDWRSDAARPFYLATAAAPHGVARRRHIRTSGRTVVHLDDEVLDLTAADPAGSTGLAGEATLFAALGAGRTGRMRDIVETIQAEQDQIIRSDVAGLLVVQGGPGTGKTAVALHRVAYLLYTHRRELSTRAVLVVGPNATFLNYISQVLPSLAETGVLLCTPGDLFPGVTARRDEPAEVAEIKGRPVMVDVLAAAVADRQRLPDEPVEINVEQDTLLLDPAAIAAARTRARRSGKLHNLARPMFDTEIIHALAAQLAAKIGADPLGGDNLLDEADIAEIRRELRREPEVLAVLDWLWPILTPQQLVAGLFASAARLAAAAPQLTAAERDLLRREPRGGWSPADVPLLDEAAELLGEDATVEAVLAERERQRQIEYAEGALEIAMGSRSIDVEDEAEPELLAATDLIDADRLADRHGYGEQLTAAQRAAVDRRWAFGHIVVDEAQELSPMAWRLLMRRAPNRSMTVVGDVAQTGDLGGTSSWAQVFEPYVADRWRLAELQVNYRTPAEIMSVAGRLLADIDPTLTPPRSVRETGVPPWATRTVPAELPARLVDAVSREAAAVADGRLGVIVPAARLAELGRAVATAVPDATAGDRSDLVDRVVVLTVRQAKGLEFDSVIVVEPAEIAAESPRGDSDLYVALTRATRRLGIVHGGELPAALADLADRPT